MSALRPTVLIEHELATAEELRSRLADQTSDDPFVRMMTADNDLDIGRLTNELRHARTTELEVSFIVLALAVSNAFLGVALHVVAARLHRRLDALGAATYSLDRRVVVLSRGVYKLATDQEKNP